MPNETKPSLEAAKTLLDSIVGSLPNKVFTSYPKQALKVKYEDRGSFIYGLILQAEETNNYLGFTSYWVRFHEVGALFSGYEVTKEILVPISNIENYLYF